MLFNHVNYAEGVDLAWDKKQKSGTEKNLSSYTELMHSTLFPYSRLFWKW